MKYFSVLVFSIILATFGQATYSQAADNKAASVSLKSSFLVVYSPGPSWIKGKSAKEQPLKEHFKYLTGLFEKGILKLGGPFSDGSGGAALIEAKDETDALAVIQNDPAVKSGVMTPKITKWELVSWEKYVKN